VAAFLARHFKFWIEDKTDGNADRSQKIESNA